MTPAINFLAKQQEIHQSRTAADRRVSVWIIALLSVTAIVYLAIRVGNMYFKKETIAKEQAITAIQDRIEQNNDHEQAYLIFYEKLTRLQQLLKQREGGMASLDYLYHYFASTGKSTITDISYDYSEREVLASISCSDVFCVKDVIDLVHAPEFEQRFPNYTLTNLSRSGNGTYSLRLNILLSGGVSFDTQTLDSDSEVEEGGLEENNEIVIIQDE